MTRPGSVVALALALSGAACLGPSPRLIPPEVHMASGAAWPGLPDSYRMIHRVHLDVRGRSLDFLGYLAVSGSRWRAVAFTEMGGRLFDLISENGRPEVLLSPPGMPRAALLDGVMRDIAAAFVPAWPSGRPAGRGEGGPVLADGTSKVVLRRGGETISEITLLSTRSVDGWPSAVPDRVSMRNLHWGYVMEAKLVRLDLRPVDEAAFRRGKAGK